MLRGWMFQSIGTVTAKDLSWMDLANTGAFLESMKITAVSKAYNVYVHMI